MGWVNSVSSWAKGSFDATPRIGLALGGGFARGIAHIGVLRVLEREGIPIHCISGVSAGSIIAAAYASGATPGEIEAVGATMRFRDVARWTLNRYGLAGSERMVDFLHRLLKKDHFEDMKIPLAVVASDICAGGPVVFRGSGDVVLPIRASCAYPGLFQPIRTGGKCLVDGMVAMEIPAHPLRQMGATHVISVSLPNPAAFDPDSMFSVVNRCFQVMSRRSERDWRRYSNIVIEPQVSELSWDSFSSCRELIVAGEQATIAVLPHIKRLAKQRTAPATVPMMAPAA